MKEPIILHTRPYSEESYRHFLRAKKEGDPNASRFLTNDNFVRLTVVAFFEGERVRIGFAKVVSKYFDRKMGVKIAIGRAEKRPHVLTIRPVCTTKKEMVDILVRTLRPILNNPHKLNIKESYERIKPASSKNRSQSRKTIPAQSAADQIHETIGEMQFPEKKIPREIAGLARA